MEYLEREALKGSDDLQSLARDAMRHGLQEDVGTRELHLHIRNRGFGVGRQLADVVLNGGGGFMRWNQGRGAIALLHSWLVRAAWLRGSWTNGQTHSWTQRQRSRAQWCRPRAGNWSGAENLTVDFPLLLGLQGLQDLL